jgi:hypothetical protein
MTTATQVTMIIVITTPRIIVIIAITIIVITIIIVTATTITIATPQVITAIITTTATLQVTTATTTTTTHTLQVATAIHLATAIRQATAIRLDTHTLLAITQATITATPQVHTLTASLQLRTLTVLPATTQDTTGTMVTTNHRAITPTLSMELSSLLQRSLNQHHLSQVPSVNQTPLWAPP